MSAMSKEMPSEQKIPIVPSTARGMRNRILELTIMLWNNCREAFLTATKEMHDNAVAEFAARNIRNKAAFAGDFSKRSSGASKSTHMIKIVPNSNAKHVTTIIAVLKIFFLSLPGKNLIIEASRPNFASIMISPMDEMIAVAVPTSSVAYVLAASTQNMNPKPALERDASMMNMELLNRGSCKC